MRENVWSEPGKQLSAGRLVRLAWYPCFGLASLILIISIPGLFSIASGGVTDSRFSANSSPLLRYLVWTTVVAVLVTAFLSLVLSLILYRRRSTNRMALITSFFLLAYGIVMVGPAEALEIYLPGAAAVTQNVLIPLLVPFIFLLFAIFPDGRFAPRQVRWLIIAAFMAVPFSLFWSSLYTQAPADFSHPLVSISAGIGIVLMLALWFGLLGSQVYRYRNISTPEQRQQTKWVVFGIVVWLACQLLTSIPWVYSYSLPDGSPIPIWLLAITPIWVVSVAILPVTLTVAILRYRLFEIDFLINRSLVYGMLSAVVIAIYVVIVGSLGMLFQEQGNLLVALVATGLVALLFQPLRDRLQRSVNRLLYGHRDDPLQTLLQLGQRLESAAAPEVVLPELVETIAGTLKLPYVAIALRRGQIYEIAAQSGAATENEQIIPLIYQGETVGQLLAAPRSPGETFGRSDKKLLESIAHQAGFAAYALQLTEDLRQSRVRLVTAREEERRRLRRDLHDGLGPVLASQGLKLAAAGQLLQDYPAESQRLLDELAKQNEATVAEIRRLIYELRPAALDDLGLEEAIRDYACGLKDGGHHPRRLHVDIMTPVDGLPELPAAVEVAAYRIATEALTNVFRHAEAEQACVTFLLASNNFANKLLLQISDDGKGLADDHRSGIGLISMRERAEEIGGTFHIESSPGMGTRLITELPLKDAP